MGEFSWKRSCKVFTNGGGRETAQIDPLPQFQNLQIFHPLRAIKPLPPSPNYYGRAFYFGWADEETCSSQEKSGIVPCHFFQQF